MAEWYENDNGTAICVNDKVRTAYLIILLLEKEKVPRTCVSDIFETVKDILRFQEVTHTERNERDPRFPKERLCQTLSHKDPKC